MDPLTAIVTAMALGAAAGLQETATSAVKDAYASLKGLVARNSSRVDVAQIERDPASPTRRSLLAEELRAAGAETSTEIVHGALSLIDLIEDETPDAAAFIGIDLENLRARTIELRDITVTAA